MTSKNCLSALGDPLDRSALSRPPAELWRFAKKESFRHEPGRERRHDRRYSLITNVIVRPVDQKLRSVGRPFVALTSGMSVSGIRLIHTCPSPSELVLLEFEHQPVQLLLTVLRSRSVGDCFEIAGRLQKADVADQIGDAPAPLTDAPALVTPERDMISLVAYGANHDELASNNPELDQWAGLTAAAQLLRAEWKSQPLSTPTFR